jgi:hypothetical protein
MCTKSKRGVESLRLFGASCCDTRDTESMVRAVPTDPSEHGTLGGIASEGEGDGGPHSLKVREVETMTERVSGIGWDCQGASVQMHSDLLLASHLYGWSWEKLVSVTQEKAVYGHERPLTPYQPRWSTDNLSTRRASINVSEILDSNVL